MRTVSRMSAISPTAPATTSIRTNIPDECEPDCNGNQTPDDFDLSSGTSSDCNANSTPDECEVLPVLEQVAYEPHPWFPDWEDHCYDCNSGIVSLPSPITLRGETYVAFVQDANGYVELLRSGEVPYDYGYGDVDDLINEGEPDHTYLMAAYDDLTTDYFGGFGYDIRPDRVMFDWNTETYANEDYDLLNRFQIILFTDGTVQWNFITAEFDNFYHDLFSGVYFGHDSGKLFEIARETIPVGESWSYGKIHGDCNRNGVPDDCDLIAGTSADCNGNSVPDECEIAGGTETDCNTNGIPDSCEFAFPDCNSNGTPDACEPDADGDGVPDDCDVCPGFDDRADADNDGIPNDCDNCPNDAAKTEPGACGCGVVDTDMDNDGVPDCLDPCPLVGDTDGDGVQDCLDPCPNDALKLDPGICGCGTPDTDADGDGFPDCLDVLLAAFQQPDGDEPGPNLTDPMAMPCAPASTMTMSGVVFGLISIRLTRRRRFI